MTGARMGIFHRLRERYAKSRHSLPVTILRNLPLIVAITILVGHLERRGWFSSIETRAYDLWLASSDPESRRDIVLVVIDDEDYEKQFQARSPLAAKTVLEGVRRIVEAGPRVLGVDLDTTAKEYESCFQNAYSNLAHRGDIVWARPPGRGAGDRSGERHRLPEISRPEAASGIHFVEPSPERGSPAIEGKLNWGVSAFPYDSDGVIRRYWRSLHYESDAGRTTVDSFAWAIAKRSNPELEGDSSPEHEPTLIRFRKRKNPFQIVPFSDVLDDRYQRAWSKIFKGKIVLLGGRYSAARDEFATPVGRLHGVELIAHVVDAECSQTPIKELNRWVAALLDVGAGILLVMFNWRFRAPWAFYTNALLIVALSLIVSAVAFHTAAYWFNGTAVLVGVWLHCEWDQAQEGRALRRELDAYHRAYGPLSAE
jgi:CHASE2 domain-containing sensor protein